MRDFGAKLISGMRWMGLMILVANLCVASIPRCDLILSLVQQSFASQEESSKQLLHCHTAEPSQDGQQSQLHGNRICECSLAHFISFTLPALDKEFSIRFEPRSMRELYFPYIMHSANYLRSPEPPYPKV